MNPLGGRRIHRVLLLSSLVTLLVTAHTRAMTPDDRLAYRDQLLKILPPVPSFNQWLSKTNELPPDFDALPRNNALPDPLQFFDGHRVSSPADWTARRDEILKSEQQWDLGTLPPKPKIDQVIPVDETHANGYLTRNVKLQFGPQGKGSLRVQVTIPDGDGPFPVLISPNLAGWAPSLIRRGYISAGYAGNDFLDDAAPLADLYPDYDFAALARRAWAAQLVIDYLQTLPQVDQKHIGIFGYSRDGKMVAICAATARGLEVSVNDKPAGTIDQLMAGDATIVRHGIQGIWYERELPFNASLMKQGDNTLTLTIPAGSVNNGIIYDYLRLELDDTKTFTPSE
jgi:Polysaccharide lyase family 4, domain III